MAGSEDRPWDRREGESSRAYAAFVAYRDMGAARSLDAVYRKLYKPQQSTGRAAGFINDWSADWDWVARARAWDDHVERARQDAFIAESAARNRQHAAEAAQLQVELLARIRDLLADATEKELGALARLLSDATKLERTARQLGMESDEPTTGDTVEVVFSRPDDDGGDVD